MYTVRSLSAIRVRRFIAHVNRRKVRRWVIVYYRTSVEGLVFGTVVDRL